MEVAGVVFRQAPCFLSSSNSMKRSRCFFPKHESFSDKSHLQYYKGPKMATKDKEIESKKKEMKKKLKVLKGLSKKLCDFSDMGFGLNPDSGLDHQVKGHMISEATEVLLGQLEKLKLEKLESKRKKKKEEKAKKMMNGCKDSSSSSSSSDCDVRQLKTMAAPQEEATSSVVVLPSPVPAEIKIVDESSSSSVCVSSSSCSSNNNRIEVCMGGKCKKSGGGMVLESFEKAVGGDGEVAVVGCKCMGRCRDGPNVRVGNNLCIGVGLEDVHLILTNFLGSSQPLPTPALG